MADILKVDIVKNREGGTPREEWTNTYYVELTADAMNGDQGGVGIASDSIVEDVNRLANGERAMHLNNVRILRAVISTPQEGDSTEPKSVRVIPYNFLGLREIPVGAEPLPLTQVFKISFAARVGRSGQHQYRGVLLDGDVELNDGTYQIAPAKGQELLDLLMQPVYLRNLNQRLRIVKVRLNVVTARAVASISVSGVSTRQRTQKKRAKNSKSPAVIARRLAEQETEISYMGAVLRQLAQNPTVSPVAKLAILAFNRILNQPAIDTDGAAPAP